jgi:hypothetical protein
MAMSIQNYTMTIITTNKKARMMAIAAGGKVKTMETIVSAKCKGESNGNNHM